MEDRNAMNTQILGSKTTQIMMATVPHVTSDSRLRKFQAGGYLFDILYKVLKPQPKCEYKTVDIYKFLETYLLQYTMKMFNSIFKVY